MISAAKPGMTASFTYDGDGNRVSKTVNGTQTRYMVDGNNLTGYAQVVEELDAANTVQVVYTYGLDLISQNRKGFLSWSKSYYGYDATGTTRMLFDDNGTVTDTYTYEAFGTIINRTGTTTNAYLFHGEQYDADLGLYYLRARYMDNNFGRFTTMDGFEGNNYQPSSLHKYVFSNMNPVIYRDPSGYMSIMECFLMTTILSMIFVAPVNAPGLKDLAQHDESNAEVLLNVFGGAIALKGLSKAGGFAFKGLSPMLESLTARVTTRVSMIGMKITGVFEARALPAEIRSTFSYFSANKKEQMFGKFLYRVEGGPSKNFGGFYSTEKPISRGIAEKMFNLKNTSGNTMKRVVTYRVKDSAIGWEGGIRGGSGTQVYFSGNAMERSRYLEKVTTEYLPEIEDELELFWGNSL